MSNKINLAEIDVVYPLKRTDDCSELRYSLRSIEENMPHRDVWIISDHLPDWASPGLHLIPFLDTSTAFANVNAKLLAAIEEFRISDPFVFMMDDVFALHPVKTIPFYAIGRDMQERANSYTVHGSYAKDLDRSRVVLMALNLKAVDFEAHAPIIVHKDEMEGVLRSFPWSGHRRSIYANMQKFKPKYVDDFKVYYSMDKPDPSRDYLSVSEESWRVGSKSRDFINQRFTEPSRYEKGA